MIRRRNLHPAVSWLIVACGAWLSACPGSRNPAPPVDWKPILSTAPCEERRTQANAEAAKLTAGALSPLHKAVLRGSPDSVKAILARCGAIDLPDEGGATPLHHAAALGLGEIVNLLVAAGARPERRDLFGKVPANYVPVGHFGEPWVAMLTSSAGPPDSPAAPSPEPSGQLYLPPYRLPALRVGGDSPAYPKIARKRGVEAVILARIDLRPDGTVAKFLVLAGHPLFNVAVTRAVQGWTFRLTGQAAEKGAYTVYKFAFKLE